MTIDEQRMEDFVNQVAVDASATFHAATVLLGDRLGLYKALATSAWTSPADLAKKTGTDTRLVAEWLAAQAASGYAEHDAETGRFRLPEEQALVLASEENPVVFVPALSEIAGSIFKDVDTVAEAFRSGNGLPWSEHHTDLFPGTERGFRPNYIGGLVEGWLPALDGVTAKLDTGARVADVGCGHGASTILMAQAYPASTFVGFDSHAPSIKAARKKAAEAGVAERCTFEVATAKDYPGTGYDLVGYFDSLHDLGDPRGALAHTKETLAADGTVLLVEPYAGDSIAENTTPVGRMFYSASTMVCTPGSLSQEVGTGLGAQAGEARLREVAAEAGLSRFRRAAETPFNLILEARP